MKVLALALFVVAIAASAQAHHRKVVATPLDKAFGTLAPLTADENLAVVHDCHELHLKAEDVSKSDSVPVPAASHASAYSCYTTEKPLYEALVEVDVQLAGQDRSLPDDLKKLLTLTGEDNAYFRLSLDDSER